MTDREKKLRLLLNIIENGYVKPVEFIPAAMDVFPSGHANALLACNGSLNAAQKLHEIFLHERVIKKEEWSKRYGCTVSLSLDGNQCGIGLNENPARAWLCAIVSALLKSEREDHP